MEHSWHSHKQHLSNHRLVAMVQHMGDNNMVGSQPF